MIKTQIRNTHPSRKLSLSNHPSQVIGWSKVAEVHSFHCDKAFICAFPNRLSNINMHQISFMSPRLTPKKKKSNIEASMAPSTYQLLLADMYPPKPNSFVLENKCVMQSLS